jgi:hypothetical protein
MAGGTLSDMNIPANRTSPFLLVHFLPRWSVLFPLCTTIFCQPTLGKTLLTFWQQLSTKHVLSTPEFLPLDATPMRVFLQAERFHFVDKMAKTRYCKQQVTFYPTMVAFLKEAE